MSAATLIARMPAPAAELVPHRAPRRAEADLLEDLAYRFGRSYDSYLVTEPGRECFWSAARDGAIVFLRRGKYLSVGGGLLAAAADKRELLAEFIDYLRANRLHASFYNIAEDELDVFREAGFQATKWGEDAVMNLGALTWSGKSFEWVRRQSNFCRRQGLVWSECRQAAMSPFEWHSLVDELQAISTARLATKPQAVETGFLDGRFDPERLGRKRLFIARSAARIEGFLICNPCQGGAEWSLEMYRQRPDGVRGTVTFLMHETLQQFQREGLRRASLCLVPALRCNQPLAGDSRLIRWGLAVSQYFNFLYDVKGLYHFKSRFRPQFENRYVCAYPRATIGSLRAFTRVSGALDLSPQKVVRCFWDHLKKWSRRATLAAPKDESIESIGRS
ncbi:MAG TPA: phosphatidylglycerol lysyltransferase domain-containing protein [Pirellulales bacterium]|nr:phosphatidylglycerol lysyltransferase domain-containing protein [Pirellulales bacterium]